MLLIWGFRASVQALARLFLQCRSCNNPAAHRLILVRRRFTLFFIPLFTYKKHHILTCAMCGYDSEISAEDAERLQVMALEQTEVAERQPQPMDQASR